MLILGSKSLFYHLFDPLAPGGVTFQQGGVKYIGNPSALGRLQAVRLLAYLTED